MKTHNWTIIGATLIAVSFLAVSPAQAGDVTCGYIIGPKETVVLHEDIGSIEPCDDSSVIWALRLRDQATLDLNGFTIFCDPDNRPWGILLDGERSKVMNGEVVDCKAGVHIAGPNPGRHTVENITADGHIEGFNIRTSRNTLSGNLATNNEFDGFLFTPDSARNKIIDNSAHYNGDDGFDINCFDPNGCAATHNHFEGNDAIQNGGMGFEVDSEFNTFLRNTAAMNGRYGFLFVESGDNNNVDQNTASENGTVPARGDGGFRFAGADANQITRNQAHDNIGTGIYLSKGIAPTAGTPADNNVVSRNNARDNTLLDLDDENAEPGDVLGLCGTNEWSKNVFTTYGAPCID